MGNPKRSVFLVHLGAGFEEASRGDSSAVKRRLAVLEGIEVLPLTDEAVSLSKALVSHGGVPEKALDDALHIAIAAVKMYPNRYDICRFD
uniref:Uncharacterized protein n=1 Tax=Candidatus Kentrum eta TaxID=2126337 RepID=A0A450VE27_9GAMM|nr:MAG: hypothetical protein BECKH772A_GA0070896_101135 [Candidatus Kentron sp. H]VFJ97581.1 MAG: hypothetical protein BECKH772B_GA0070898_1011414 [Candidatus Kentron sp. H]VFK03001.1 MAG: hypothetical protein BECKH772C_GA0070978_101115 [Candidatus Kentron sp. H]